MNILYFVEPRQELGNPLFRLGTIRNHVSKEIVELKKTTPSTTDVRLLTSTQVAKSALSEGLLDGVVLHTINQSIIEKKFPDSKAAASAWYTGAYTLNDEKVMQRLCRKSLGKFVPDIIICYESAAPYLKTLFPKAAFLNSMLGIFSRAPYPETGCFDPFGIYADSYIRKFASELLALKIDTKQSQMLTRLREKYSKFIDSNNPIRAQDIRGNYNKVLLVPLQVTGYFAFDDNLPENSDINNQLQLIKSILESVDSSVGVYVTLHGAEADVMTNGIIESLQSEYPNLLYNENIQKIRWSSQWILPYVDGVATVSSSVGLQSLFWKKPIFIIGHSHLATFNAGELESAHNILEQESDFDGALYHLLTKYYPLMSNKVQDGHWLYSFFLKAVEKHRSGEIGFDYFETQSNSDEEVFENFLSGIQTVQTLKDLKKHTSHMTPTNLVNVNEIKYQINNHDVISFDIFDTLITRKLMHPNHVFDLMHKEATDVFEFEGLSIKQFGGFRSLRERAANRIIRQAKSDNVEEISFNAIYEEMRKLTGLSKRAILVLRKLELKTEKDVTSIRQLGYDLYSYAQSLGKKVIFVSDMYLNSKDIEFLVKQNGYTNYQKCYVSSKYNKLKKSGSLFEVVKADHPGQSILHMGDNHLADVLKAVEAGLTAYHLPLISQTYMASLIAKDIFSKSEVDDCLGSSLMHGVISRKFYDNHINELDWFNGSPYRMGFEACGPILLGFTKWILEQAIRDGVEDLYFLARDGYLIKDIYDKISVNISNAPKSHYLLASRRCYNTANLKTEQDIFDSLSLTFSRTPLHKIMEARYGISLQEIDKTTIKQAGLTSVNDVIDIKIRSQKNKFKRFLSLNKDLILGKAREERDCLLEYLNSTDLDSKRKASVVDIGHNASLQRALGELLGNRTDIGGYYFMTFYGAKTVYDEGFDIKGYLADFEDNRLSSHPYCKNIGMFEFLFLPAIPSFKRFIKKENILVEEYVTGDEKARFNLIKKVHAAVMDYVIEILRTVDSNIEAYNVSSTRSLKTYIEFVQAPHQSDAMMFNKLSFVDQFGGTDSRYIIASPIYPKITSNNYSDFLRSSWWREGASAIVNGTSKQRVQSLTESTPLKSKTSPNLNESYISIYQRKFNKLKNDPLAFLNDSKVRKFITSQNEKQLKTYQRKLRKLRNNPRAFWEDSKARKKIISIVRS